MVPRAGALRCAVTSHERQHVPVLPAAVMSLLSPQVGDVVVDCTLGLGGHALLMAERIGPDGVLIGLDVDSRNLSEAERRLAEVSCRVVLERRNFVAFEDVLDEVGVDGVDVFLADLGVNSVQLGDADRGFSFRLDGPLDMRMDDRSDKKAIDLVNSLREEELSDLIYFNSQERLSRRIAKRICQCRRDHRIRSTLALAEIVCKATGIDPDSHKAKIHPATRVFQALRIAVNDELGSLTTLLDRVPARLNRGGRVGVIAFHSLEDGIVKRDFRKRKSEGEYEILTKRPVVAEPEEREANPRSRSAKLRVARRVAEVS